MNPKTPTAANKGPEPRGSQETSMPDTLTIVDPTPAVQRMFELSVVDDYLNIRHT